MNDSMVPEQEQPVNLVDLASQLDKEMGVIDAAIKNNPTRRRADRPNDLMPGTYVGKVVGTRAYEGKNGPGFAILIEFVGFSSHYGSYTWRRFGRFEKSYSLVNKDRVNDLIGLYVAANCKTQDGKDICMAGDVLRCAAPIGLVVEVEVLDFADANGNHRSFLGAVYIPDKDPKIPSDDEIDRADFFTAKSMFPRASEKPKAAVPAPAEKERVGYENDPNSPAFPWE